MKELKLQEGFYAKYHENKLFETLLIDITDFYIGGGNLSSLKIFSEMVSRLNKEGWKNNGINYSIFDGVEDVELELIKPKKQ